MAAAHANETAAYAPRSLITESSGPVIIRRPDPGPHP